MAMSLGRKACQPRLVLGYDNRELTLPCHPRVHEAPSQFPLCMEGQGVVEPHGEDHEQIAPLGHHLILVERDYAIDVPQVVRGIWRDQ